MNRLDAELHRLYLPRSADGESTSLVAPDGRVRALVLELVRPATWSDLAPVWQGVQADLDMPAPAIAVSGRGGLQLWVSLAEPVEARAAQAFLQALRARYLAGVPAERIRMEPSFDAGAGARVGHVDPMPPAQVAPERWSAFVSADLVPLFADEPWLDHPPGTEAQAELLSRLASTSPAGFRRAVERLRDAQPARAEAEPGPATAQIEDHARTAAMAADDAQDPAAFLLAVMRDPSVDLQLRIEAAKALLPFTGNTR